MPNPLYTDNYTLTELGQQASHDIRQALEPLFTKYNDLGANLRELAGLIADESLITAAEAIIVYQVEQRKRAREEQDRRMKNAKI